MWHQRSGITLPAVAGDVRFVKCARMLADLAGGHADRTIGQRMREYTRPLVLIIDLSRPRNCPDMGIGVVTGCVVRVGFWDVWA